MTLVLPPFLPPILVTLVAGHFPDGDEDVMGGLAEAAWIYAKEQVDELADNQAAWAPRLTDFVIGESGMAAVEGMLAAEQNLRELAELFENLAQQLKSGARDIEFEKLVVIFTLLILAVQLTLAVAFPGGALVALARWITAKKTIQSVYLQLLARLAVNGADFLGSQPLLSILLRGGGAGAIQGGGADLAAQYVQIGAETRDTVDRRQLAVSTASGFAGGVAGDVAARWVQPLTDRLGELAGAAVGRRTRWTVELAVPAGVGGAAGAVAGAGAGVLMVGGDFGDIDLALTLFQGAGGGIIGAAGYALRPPAAAVPGPFEAAVPRRFEQDSGPLRRLGSETVPVPSYGDSGNATGPGVHVRATEPAPPRARPGHDRSPAPPLSHGVSVALPAQPPPAVDIGVSTESPGVTAPGTEVPPAREFSEAPPTAAATAVDPPSAVGPEDAAPQPARQIAVDAEPEALGTVEPVREDVENRPVGAEVADTATTEFNTRSSQVPESIRVPAAETGVPPLDRATAASPESSTFDNSGTRPEPSPDVHPARQPGERDLLTPETGDVAQPGFDGPPLPGGAVEVPTPPPRTAPNAARSNPGRTTEFAARAAPAKESARTSTQPATRIEPAPAVFAPSENVRHSRPSESAVTAPDHADPPPVPDRGAVGLPASSDISPAGEAATGAAARAPDQYDVRARDTTAPGDDEPGDQADDEAGRSFDELTTDPGVAPADQYAPLEDSAHLTAVQEALRGPDGRPLVHADPSVNRYGQLINDGGFMKPGRSNNCVQLAMDALLSYYGRPAVGRARIEDGSDDGFLGERYGGERLEVWAGRNFRRPSGAETVGAQFAGVHAEVSGMRPGSAAVVGVQWRAAHSDMDPAGTDAHILTVVYPEGAAGPVWWDAQSGETWHSPPDHWIAHSDDLVYIPITEEQGAAIAAATIPDEFRYELGPVVTTGVAQQPEAAPVVHRPEFFALAAGAPRPVPDSLPVPADYPPNATGFTRWLRDTAVRLRMDERRFDASTGPETAGAPNMHRAKDSAAEGGARRPAVRNTGKEIYFPADPGPQNSYDIVASSVLGDQSDGDVRSEWTGTWNTAFDDRDRIVARRGEIYRESVDAARLFSEKAAEYGIDTPVTGNNGRPYRSADDVIRLSVSKHTTEFERMRVALENDEGLTQVERDRLADVFTELKQQLYNYHSLAVELIAASKEMGMAAGVLYALDSRERPDAVLLVPHPTAFDGPNVVDIASFVPASGDRPPKLVIVEAKGGKVGTLTPAGVYDRQKRDFVNAQQGSPEYLRRTLASDTNLRRLLNDPLNVLSERDIHPDSSEGRELIRTVGELIRAHRNGTLEIEYHKVHARENGTVKAGRFNLDPGDPKRPPVEIASIGGILREAGDRSGDPEGHRATARRPPDGDEGPEHAVVQRIRDQVGAEILRSAIARFGRRDPDDVLHRLATRIETAADNPPSRGDSFEKVASIRDIDASKADLVRTMLSAWLGPWSADPAYLHDIADTVAATVAAATGAVEVVVAAHGIGDDKGPREITVIETVPGNADNRAETVWRLSPEPAVVERAAPAAGKSSRDERDHETAAPDARVDRSEVHRQTGRVRAQLRSAHPWMTADQIDSAGAMFAQTYTRALADSPDPAGRVTIESTVAGPHARGTRVTITSTLAEGRAALLGRWYDDLDSGPSAGSAGRATPGPHHLARADASGRTIELAAAGRTAVHWFEIHHGSARQAATDTGSAPAQGTGLPRYGSHPGTEGTGEPPRGSLPVEDVSIFPATDLESLGVTPHWRADRDLLYRADNRTPDDVFSNGLTPHNNTIVDLEEYIDRNVASALVGTSRREDIGSDFGRRYLYTLDVPGGIDVDRTLSSPAWESEGEIVFPGGVRSEYIAGVREYNPESGEYGTFHPNPNFGGSRSSTDGLTPERQEELFAAARAAGQRISELARQAESLRKTLSPLTDEQGRIDLDPAWGLRKRFEDLLLENLEVLPYAEEDGELRRLVAAPDLTPEDIRRLEHYLNPLGSPDKRLLSRHRSTESIRAAAEKLLRQRDARYIYGAEPDRRHVAGSELDHVAAAERRTAETMAALRTIMRAGVRAGESVLAAAADGATVLDFDRLAAVIAAARESALEAVAGGIRASAQTSGAEPGKKLTWYALREAYHRRSSSMESIIDSLTVGPAEGADIVSLIQAAVGNSNRALLEALAEPSVTGVSDAESRAGHAAQYRRAVTGLLADLGITGSWADRTVADLGEQIVEAIGSNTEYRISEEFTAGPDPRVAAPLLRIEAGGYSMSSTAVAEIDAEIDALVTGVEQLAETLSIHEFSPVDGTLSLRWVLERVRPHFEAVLGQWCDWYLGTEAGVGDRMTGLLRRAADGEQLEPDRIRELGEYLDVHRRLLPRPESEQQLRLRLCDEAHVRVREVDHRELRSSRWHGALRPMSDLLDARIAHSVDRFAVAVSDVRTAGALNALLSTTISDIQRGIVDAWTDAGPHVWERVAALHLSGQLPTDSALATISRNSAPIRMETVLTDLLSRMERILVDVLSEPSMRGVGDPNLREARIARYENAVEELRRRVSWRQDLDSRIGDAVDFRRALDLELSAREREFAGRVVPAAKPLWTEIPDVLDTIRDGVLTVAEAGDRHHVGTEFFAPDECNDHQLHNLTDIDARGASGPGVAAHRGRLRAYLVLPSGAVAQSSPLRVQNAAGDGGVTFSAVDATAAHDIRGGYIVLHPESFGETAEAGEAAARAVEQELLTAGYTRDWIDSHLILPAGREDRLGYLRSVQGEIMGRIELAGEYADRYVAPWKVERRSSGEIVEHLVIARPVDQGDRSVINTPARAPAQETISAAFGQDVSRTGEQSAPASVLPEAHELRAATPDVRPDTTPQTANAPDPAPEIGDARADLESREIGRWALETLDRHGIEIRYRPESMAPMLDYGHGRSRAFSYDPSDGILYWGSADGAATPVDRVDSLVYAAAMLDHRPYENTVEPSNTPREEYVAAMLDRAAQAYALVYELHRTVEAGLGATSTASGLRSIYRKAYAAAWEQANAAFSDDRTIPARALAAAAYRAGVRTVRDHLDEAGPLRAGRTLSGYYRAEWDRAHGISPEPPVFPGPPVPRAVGLGPPIPDTPADRRELARAYIGEIEALRARRTVGERIPIGPAERAYTAAYERARRRARWPLAGGFSETGARQAGRQAVHRYLDKVGPARAEIAFDVVRAYQDTDGRYWGSPRTAGPGQTDRNSGGAERGSEDAGVPDTTDLREAAIRAIRAKYAEIIPDGGRVVAVAARGRSTAGEALPVYEIRRYSGGTPALVVLQIRVYAPTSAIPGESVSDAVQRAQRVVDRSLNLSRPVLPDGERLLVELMPTADPNAAHLVMRSGEWEVGDDAGSSGVQAGVVVDQLRQHMGLAPAADHHSGFGRDDLQTIAHDIEAAPPADPALLSSTRVVGPGMLAPLEDPAFLTAVQEPLYDGGRYLVWADPMTNEYGARINDGGPGQLGRFHNCVDCVLAALDAFYGRPQVAHPRWSDHRWDRESLFGELGGDHRVQGALGRPWRPLGISGASVPLQLAMLSREVYAMGEGAVAVIANSWQARDPRTGEILPMRDGIPQLDGGHVTLLVYPKGAPGPVWWDPQSGTAGLEVPQTLATESAAIRCITIPPDDVPSGGSSGAAPAPGYGAGSESNPAPGSGPRDDPNESGHDFSAVDSEDGSPAGPPGGEDGRLRSRSSDGLPAGPEEGRGGVVGAADSESPGVPAGTADIGAGAGARELDAELRHELVAARASVDNTEAKVHGAFEHSQCVALYNGPHGNRLWYSAQQHSTNAADPQYAVIRQEFEQFIDTPGPKIVLLEGTGHADRDITGMSLDEVIENYADGTHLFALADRHGIPSRSADIAKVDFLLAAAPAEEGIHHLYDFMISANAIQENDKAGECRTVLYDYAGRSFGVRVPEVLIERVEERERLLQGMARWPRNGGPQTASIADMLRWHHEFQGKPFDIRDKAVEVISPNHGDTAVNRISRYRSDHREQVMTGETLRWLRAGYSVFTGAGASHYWLQRGVLARVLGEPFAVFRHGEQSGNGGESFLSDRKLNRALRSVETRIAAAADPEVREFLNEERRTLLYLEAARRTSAYPRTHEGDVVQRPTPWSRRNPPGDV